MYLEKTKQNQKNPQLSFLPNSSFKNNIFPLALVLT